MKTLTWEDIKDLYNKARYCLCCPRHVSQWSRDEENGMFYLWSAYHYARTTEDQATDHLTYARILRLMASETAIDHSEYERYHNFILPALQEYEAAVKSGQKVGDKEFDSAKFDKEHLGYQLNHESCSEENWNEAIALIENGDMINKTDFGFHDSKPVGFELISDKQAVLKLNYDNLLAVLRFENIAYIEIATDPETDWISDFYCYKVKDSDLVTFDIEYYRIICRKVVLEKIVDFNKYKDPTPDAFFWSKPLQIWCCQQAVNEKYLTNRVRKAKEQMSLKPAEVSRVIRLTNEILAADGIQEIQNPVIRGKALEKFTSADNTTRKEAYEAVKNRFGMASVKHLLWLRFTQDGHLATVAASDDINFGRENKSYDIIHTCGLEWDTSFILLFPITPITGRYQLQANERDELETAVGNYLIANGVPIIDYYSHNYNERGNQIVKKWPAPGQA